MSERKTSSPGGCTATWRLPPNPVRPISRSSCSCLALAHAPSARWPWSRRSCMAHPTALATRRGSRSPMAARHPYPVPLKVYDRTIGVLKTAVQKAKLGQSEELAAIKRLDEQAGRLERHASGPSVEALVTEDCARSHQYGGRSVFGAEPHAANSRDAFTPENARGGVRGMISNAVIGDITAAKRFLPR